MSTKIFIEKEHNFELEKDKIYIVVGFVIYPFTSIFIHIIQVEEKAIYAVNKFEVPKKAEIDYSDEEEEEEEPYSDMIQNFIMDVKIIFILEIVLQLKDLLLGGMQIVGIMYTDTADDKE